MLTDIQVPSMEYKDVMQSQGQSYYVFNTSAAPAQSSPLIDFSNPIFIFVVGMLLAFGISYLVYYIKKHGYSADSVMKTFFGLMGLSGIGFMLFGIVYCFFDVKTGIGLTVLGLFLTYAGGTMLSDMDKEKEMTS